jgi:hypothetical protein
MALRAGAFPEKLGHSACSQPACVGKDWCITHPIGQREPPAPDLLMTTSGTPNRLDRNGSMARKDVSAMPAGRILRDDLDRS